MFIKPAQRPDLDALAEGIEWLRDNAEVRIDPITHQPVANEFDWGLNPEAVIHNIRNLDSEFCAYSVDRPLKEHLVPVDPVAAEADRETHRLDDDKLVDLVLSQTELRKLDLEVAARDGYSYSKINHAYWEQIALISSIILGRQYTRELPVHDADRGFHELLAHLLANSPKWRGAPAGAYVEDDFSLAVGFGNGDELSTRNELRAPLHPAIRGALIGFSLYFRHVLPVPRRTFTDAAFPKMLVWDRTFREFLDLILPSTDIALFVVPSYLSGIRLKSFDGLQMEICVPPSRIYQQFSVVLPYLVGRIHELARTGASISVLCQAGAAGAALGIMLDLLTRRMPEARIRYYDLGQALDIAMLPDTRFSPWLRGSPVAEAVTSTSNPFQMNP